MSVAAQLSPTRIDPAGDFERWEEYDRGGHFPAMETPDLLVPDLRAFLRPMR
jgi:hypothetical protein